jgi:hypothetical protein
VAVSKVVTGQLATIAAIATISKTSVLKYASNQVQNPMLNKKRVNPFTG